MDPTKEKIHLDFAPLSEYPSAIPLVASWWCSEWGLPARNDSLEAYISDLAGLKPGKLPFHLLALNEGNIVGVATLKDKSALAHLFPDFKHWLSGVYVPPGLRGRGIATALCLKVVDIAKTREITRLHLATESLDGGLYTGIGWQPVKQVQVEGLDLLVMAKDVIR